MKTVVVSKCPFHGIDFIQERFICEVYNYELNQTSALGLPPIRYPQWVCDGLVIRRTVAEAFREKRKAAQQ